jgi:hypothetical protein
MPSLRAELERLVRGFNRDSVFSVKAIREILEIDPSGFYAAALDLLREGDDSRGSQYLITTLVGQNLFLAALSDPALTEQQAAALARAARKTSANVDIDVAKHLTQRVSAGGSNDEIQRLMAILCTISDGTRIMPQLLTLARQPNPYLQSKAVLMIGRANHSVKWLRKRLEDPDARIRANALEALWGVDTEESREILRKTAQDAHNRVAGNALLGLYLLGDTSSILEILKLAEHESRNFRATAAWIMGRTEDPRFTKALARLMGETATEVRARAFSALGLVRSAAAKASQAGEWRVVGQMQRSTQTGWRRLQAEVSSLDGKRQVKLVPTQFLLAEDGLQVNVFSVDEKPAPEALSITFLYPRVGEVETAPLNQGAVAGLRWKRPSDLWSAIAYLPTRHDLQVRLAGQKIELVPEGSADAESMPMTFTCDPVNARAMLLRAQPKVECTELWGSLRRAVQLEGGPARGQRHVVLYSLNESAPSSLYPEVVSAARHSRTTMHVIALVANPMLENLCQMTHGTFQLVESESEVAEIVEHTCLNLVARYSIRYEPVCPDAQALSIRVQSPEGWGEAEIPIRPGARAM